MRVFFIDFLNFYLYNFQWLNIRRADFKEMIFWELKSDFEKEGINEYSDISDETIEAIAEKITINIQELMIKFIKKAKLETMVSCIYLMKIN